MGPWKIRSVSPSAHPAATTSSMADWSRATMGPNDFLSPKMTSLALTTNAAIRAPSITWYGSLAKMVRSLKVPGSPSAPLTITVVARSGDW